MTRTIIVEALELGNEYISITFDGQMYTVTHVPNEGETQRQAEHSLELAQLWYSHYCNVADLSNRTRG